VTCRHHGLSNEYPSDGNLQQLAFAEGLAGPLGKDLKGDIIMPSKGLRGLIPTGSMQPHSKTPVIGKGHTWPLQSTKRADGCQEKMKFFSSEET
jgi:hypothetical protein